MPKEINIKAMRFIFYDSKFIGSIIFNMVMVFSVEYLITNHI